MTTMHLVLDGSFLLSIMPIVYFLFMSILAVFYYLFHGQRPFCDTSIKEFFKGFYYPHVCQISAVLFVLVICSHSSFFNFLPCPFYDDRYFILPAAAISAALGFYNFAKFPIKRISSARLIQSCTDAAQRKLYPNKKSTVLTGPFGFSLCPKWRKNYNNLRANVVAILDHLIPTLNAHIAGDCDTVKATFLDSLSASIQDPETRSLLASWPDGFDYTLFSYKFIYSTAFDAASSGQYHFYAGQLNPTGILFRSIAIYCQAWFYDHSYVTAEQRDSQVAILDANISHIG